MTDIENNESAPALVPVLTRAPVRPDSPTFAELGVRAETVEALASAGITRAFAIQEYALPIALRGTDLIGQAPTGTGKTLGFGLPLLERVLAPSEGADGQPQALVVVPTRELGLQVARDIQAAGSTRGVRVLPVYGGVAYETQVETLRNGVDITVPLSASATSEVTDKIAIVDQRVHRQTQDGVEHASRSSPQVSTVPPARQ